MCECKDGPLKITMQTLHGYHHEIKLLLTYLLTLNPYSLPIRNYASYTKSLCDNYTGVDVDWDKLGKVRKTTFRKLKPTSRALTEQNATHPYMPSHFIKCKSNTFCN